MFTSSADAALHAAQLRMFTLSQFCVEFLASLPAAISSMGRR